MRQGLTTSEAGKLGAQAAADTIARNKQHRIDTWNSSPKLCKCCETPITYENRKNDFCNRSCSATFNNQGIRRHGEAPVECLNCGAKTWNDKFCSRDCNSDFDWAATKIRLLETGVDNSAANRAGKKYLTELHEGKCQNCGLNEWLGKLMPLVLDHIDGNPYNNLISNLRIICNNCDAISPTFKGRNKGNGRFKRAERYKYEKEHLEGVDFKH